MNLPAKPNQRPTTSTGEFTVTNNSNQADGFSVAEKGGNNMIVGKMQKFTIDGKYKVDKADILPDNTSLVAIDVITAWVKWDDGKPIEHRITRPGQLHPDRADLPDQDESIWEPGINGEPADPWKDTRYLRLIDPRTGQDYTFVTDTYGGRKAVGDLKSQINNVRFAYPGAVPVVQLSTTMMKMAFGLKPRPEFKVIGWRNKQERAVPLPNEIKPPFNDEIPDFDKELIPWE